MSLPIRYRESDGVLALNVYSQLGEGIDDHGLSNWGVSYDVNIGKEIRRFEFDRVN